MEPTTIGVLGFIFTIASFLYGVYRIRSKDVEVRRDKVIEQLDDCILKNTKTNESMKRLHQRIDTVEVSQAKLENAVEKMMDKLDVKLDKIMDFLLDNRRERRVET